MTLYNKCYTIRLDRAATSLEKTNRKGTENMKREQLKQAVNVLALTAIEKQNVLGEEEANSEVLKLWAVAIELAEYWGEHDLIDAFQDIVPAPENEGTECKWKNRRTRYFNAPQQSIYVDTGINPINGNHVLIPDTGEGIALEYTPGELVELQERRELVTI